MKLNKYFMMAAMGLGLVACSDNLDDGQGANGNASQEGTTYVAFSLDFKGAGSRAETTEADTEEESNITTAYVIVAREGRITEFISNTTSGTEEGSDGSKYVADENGGKYLLKVPAGMNDFYAVVNPDEAPTVGGTIENYFNTAVSLSLADVVTDNKFMMASEAVLTRNVLDNVTEEQALDEGANNFEITVERVSAKVTVTCDDPSFTNEDGSVIEGKLVKDATTFKLKNIPSMAYRMRQASVTEIESDDLNYSTVYSDPNSTLTDKTEIPVYFPATSGEQSQWTHATAAYCLENLHTTYYQHNTTYINLKTAFIPAVVVNCDSETGETKDNPNADGTSAESFYVVEQGDLYGNYILADDLAAYRKTNGDDALPAGVDKISELYENGVCYFNNIWVGQEKLGSSDTAPINRNTWYNLAITGIVLPGDNEEKNPNPNPDPGEELPLEPETNVVIEVIVPDWKFVTNGLVLGE